MKFSGIDYECLFDWMEKNNYVNWQTKLEKKITENLSTKRWGDLPYWQSSLKKLPELQTNTYKIESVISIGHPKEINLSDSEILRSCLKNLHPWRKGPFSLFGIDIDSEWKANLKWDRLLPNIDSLDKKLVLDIGCGNGYYMHRMINERAKRVIGIDPSVKFLYQFYALKKYIQKDTPIDIVPLKDDDLPDSLPIFDTVFSMGVLSHRKDPKKHLGNIIRCLKPGGQVVLETLVINEDHRQSLQPQNRYAKMRNIWELPTPTLLTEWLDKCDFLNPKVVDINTTSIEEQRTTEWMTFESLENFLDSSDSDKTIEGYPAPTRVIMTAQAPH